MSGIFYKLWENIVTIFSGRNLFLQTIGIGMTAFFVLSGFDWWYFEATRNTSLTTIGFTAALVGFLVPICIPLGLYLGSIATRAKHLQYSALATIQAGFLGLGLSSLYKVFTGRVGLPHTLAANTSEMFRFGIYRGGAFQGWPSSHTAVAFAMSMALVALYPKNRTVKILAIVYALYIGLGVSVTIHWFSDFFMGAILGTIIGITVGKQFLQKEKLVN